MEMPTNVTEAEKTAAAEVASTVQQLKADEETFLSFLKSHKFEAAAVVALVLAIAIGWIVFRK